MPTTRPKTDYLNNNAINYSRINAVHYESCDKKINSEDFVYLLFASKARPH